MPNTTKLTLELFYPGADVWYHGDPYRVNYITIRGGRLYVNLYGFPVSIRSDELRVNPTVIEIDRPRLNR